MDVAEIAGRERSPPKDLCDIVQEVFDSMGEGNNFNRIVKKMKIVSAVAPTVIVELTLAEEHVNDKGTMHGGFTAALVDILTATSVRLNLRETPIVSIDLSITYLLPAKKGEVVLMEATCIKAGRSIAFTEAVFRRKADDAMIVRARQQLAILFYRPPISTTSTTPNGFSLKNGDLCQEEKEQVSTAPPLEKSEDDGTLLGRMRQVFLSLELTENFNRIAKGMRVLKAEPLSLVVEFRLQKEHLNEGGTMHGGFIASLVDIVTARAVGMTETCPMVSLDISVSYMLPAVIGDEIVIEANCLKTGRSMSFAEASFTRKRDGALIAKGKHNLYMLRWMVQPTGGGARRLSQY